MNEGSFKLEYFIAFDFANFVFIYLGGKSKIFFGIFNVKEYAEFLNLHVILFWALKVILF